VSRRIILYLIFFILALSFIILIAKNFTGSFGDYFLKGNFLSIIGNLQSHYVETTLGISKDTGLIYRFFQYMFYPFPWTSHGGNFMILIMSIENTYLIYLFFIILLNNTVFKYFNIYYFFGFLSFLILFVLLATVTSNLGIAFRQKWLIIPYLFILFSSSKKKTTSL